MKEPNLSRMAYNLLDAAAALAGILDQRVEGNCIKVNFAYAVELVRNMQLSAKSVADELMFIHEQKGGEE